MANFIQSLHHSNCNCCGRKASFTELARRPSGFGPLKPLITHSRPNTHHGTIQPLGKRVSEQVRSASLRRRSLQNGSKSTREISAQKTFDVLSDDNRNTEEIAMEIAEVVAERSMFQATESRMKGTSRDKESLLEECVELKEALCDQLYHLQLHRVHHETIDNEQRKMEITIQELEMAHGLQAPRTGDPSQLKARILGLKCRRQEYYNILTLQQNDIEILKKDTRVSFTKEAFVERDIFATETRRLQKMIQCLRVLYHKVCSDNNEVVRLRDNIATLYTKITKITTNIKNSKSIIVQMKIDIDQAKIDSIEAQKNTRNAISKAGELQSHYLVLQNMLAHEKEEAIGTHKQASTLGEQLRIVKQENSNRVLQKALATRVLATDAKKSAEKGGKKRFKIEKRKDYVTDDSTSETWKDLSVVRSTPSSPATPSSQSTVHKNFDTIRTSYMKAIGKAANTFVETAPGSGSPTAKPRPNLDSPTGDHFAYEKLQETFQKDVFDAENKFMDKMDELEYGAAQPRKDFEAEAKRLRAQLEAIQKQQLGVNKWLDNLTIELDDQKLKTGEYVIDVKNAKTNVKITSSDKTPEALARKKAEEESRRRREAEEAARRAAEEETRQWKVAEEDAANKRTRDAAEEEAVNKRKRDAAEEEAANKRKKDAAEEEAANKRKKDAVEEEAANKRKKDAAEEEAANKRKRDLTEEEAAFERKRDAAEEAARRAVEEEADSRRKRDLAEEEAVSKRRRDLAEEEATFKRKRDAAEEAARRAVEEEAASKRKRDAAEEEAANKRKKDLAEAEAAFKRKRDAAEEEAASKKKRDAEEEAVRRKKDEEEEIARRKRAAEDEAAAMKTNDLATGSSSTGDKKDEFFSEEMQGSIKDNIKEVLGHLEVISKTVQQKASPSGSAESAAKDALKKLDEPPDKST